MKQYYEGYWQRPDTYAEPDPLASTRSRLLWEALATEERGPGEELSKRSFVDIGCGEGRLVSEALQRGYQATGLDISEVAVERARRLHPEASFYAHPVEQLPWPLPMESVSVVASFEVIEHLVQPAELLRGAREVLRPGGNFALTTPHHGLLKNVAIALRAFDKHFAVEGDHIRFFSDRSLRILLEREGFEVLSIKHFGRLPGVWAGVFVWSKKR